MITVIFNVKILMFTAIFHVNFLMFTIQSVKLSIVIDYSATAFYYYLLIKDCSRVVY